MSATSTILQYVVVRSDLGWPLGALIAQACHASSAAIAVALRKEDEATKTYVDNLDSMHKVVLEAKDEASLKKLEEALKGNSIEHKLWTEQPENIYTCLATKPYAKEDIQKYFKKFKLLK